MGPSRLTRAGLMVGAAAAMFACAEPTSSPSNLRNTLTPSLGVFLPVGGTANTAEAERIEVCKNYVMTSGAQPPALTSFTVNGPGTVNGVFTLAPNTCREVWVGHNESVTIVEEDLSGSFTQECLRTLLDASTAACTDGRTATSFVNGTVGAQAGELVVFTNTEIVPPPPPSSEGRMTGGGVQFYGEARISRGFTIHCDIILSNNLEINWPGNKWHLDKPLTSAYCFDDPAVDHGPPAAPFDTFVGEGTGRLNGVDGALIKFTFVDAGEPGKNDKTQVQIWAPDGTLVLDTPLSTLVHGNIQAHYDQPHGNKP